jgi:hypothetical protein
VPRPIAEQPYCAVEIVTSLRGSRFLAERPEARIRHSLRSPFVAGEFSRHNSGESSRESAGDVSSSLN